MRARSPEGEEVHPYGEIPFGWLMYLRNGRMAVILMRPDRPNFEAASPLGGTREEIEDAYRGFDAYCGTYTFYSRRSRIVHHVEASKFPNWVGTDQTRSLHLESGRLCMSAPLSVGGEVWDFEAVWERP